MENSKVLRSMVTMSGLTTTVLSSVMRARRGSSQPWKHSPVGPDQETAVRILLTAEPMPYASEETQEDERTLHPLLVMRRATEAASTAVQNIERSENLLPPLLPT